MKLLTHQVTPSSLVTDCLLDTRNNAGRLVIGPTGCGKTYIMAWAIKQAQITNPEWFTYNDNEMFRLHPIMVITTRNAITQMQREFSKCGLKSVEVVSADSLRGSYGENYIDWITTTDGKNREVIKPVWREAEMPRVIFFDECQNGRNPKSQRSKVLQSYIDQGGKVIFVSATPFQKGVECKLIATGCRLTTSEEFNFWVSYTTNYQQDENSPTAIARIKKVLEDNGLLINVSNVRYPFKPITRNWLIDPTPEQAKAIATSYAKYCEARDKAGKGQHSDLVAKWQAQRVMRLECELERVPNICIHAREHDLNHGKAVIIASNYIPTLKACWKYLVKTLGVNKDEISFLIGDQSDKEKQLNIDNFQQGRTKYFLTTLKSGGTGLNLHHVVEGARPRVIILPPTWSVYELLQVLGRAQRITNLSQVIQIICWFKGTVEEDVAARMEARYSCIRELISRKDNYIANIFEQALQKQTDKELLDSITEEQNESIEDSLEFVDTDDGKVVVKGKKKSSSSKDDDKETESFFDLSMLCED